MRALENYEIAMINGAGPVGDLQEAFNVGSQIGSAIYNALSPSTQDAIGGTIYMMGVNLGLIKD
jgi:hypothetical protein